MADSFGADIAAWASEAQYWASAECAKTTRSLYKRVVMYSPSQFTAPYSIGHFNKNWRVGSTAQVGEIAGTTTPQQKYAEIDAFIYDEYFLDNPSGQVSMTNSTSYVTEIEYKGWQKTAAYKPVQTALGAPVARAISDHLE